MQSKKIIDNRLSAVGCQGNLRDKLALSLQRSQRLVGCAAHLRIAGFLDRQPVLARRLVETPHRRQHVGEVECACARRGASRTGGLADSATALGYYRVNASTIRSCGALPRSWDRCGSPARSDSQPRVRLAAGQQIAEVVLRLRQVGLTADRLTEMCFGGGRTVLSSRRPAPSCCSRAAGRDPARARAAAPSAPRHAVLLQIDVAEIREARRHQLGRSATAFSSACAAWASLPVAGRRRGKLLERRREVARRAAAPPQHQRIAASWFDVFAYARASS